MPFESAHLFRRRCFNAFLSSTMVKGSTSQNPVVSISRTKLLRSGDSKPIFSKKFANSSGPGYSSSFFVEQGWIGTRAWWVKRSKSLNSSNTCWIRPFLCSRSVRRRCFRIDFDICALCDFDLAILRSTSKAWKTSSSINFCPERSVAFLFVCAAEHKEPLIQLMTVVHVQVLHVTCHDMKSDIHPNPASVSNPFSVDPYHVAIFSCHFQSGMSQAQLYGLILNPANLWHSSSTNSAIAKKQWNQYAVLYPWSCKKSTCPPKGHGDHHRLWLSIQIQSINLQTAYHVSQHQFAN